MARLKRNRQMKSNQTAVVDSGYWFALLDETDPYHSKAQETEEMFLNIRHIFPWPILYETLCTRYTRRSLIIRKFEKFLKRPTAIILDDNKYKDKALDMTLSMSGRGWASKSLVDNVLRMIIDDANVRVNCIFTFNQRDFYDICVPRNVEIYPSEVP